MRNLTSKGVFQKNSCNEQNNATRVTVGMHRLTSVLASCFIATTIVACGDSQLDERTGPQGTQEQTQEAASGSQTSSTPAESIPLFYRGDNDGEKVTAENGAIVNKSYQNYVKQTSGDELKLIKVRDGVHTMTGYSLGNYTFIEGKTGLIAFDAGNNMGMGRETLALVRKISDKPISNIIYSHHHYTAGARAYAEDARNKGVEKVNVYGHPDLEHYLKSSSITLGPMQIRRASIQLGFYLPHEGEDAYFGPSEPTFEAPADRASGHETVTHAVGDGEEVMIDGLKAIFYHAVSDTRDSLIVYFPDMDLVLHNTAAMPVSFPLYTLRGDYYRKPIDLIESLDIIRDINPTYLVGAHGMPQTTKEAGYEFVTAHRDLYSFIYNQSVRAINLGMTPDEIVNKIKLPKHLDQNPSLFPAYIDNEYSFRGQYRSIVGWYDEDTADLHPPAPEELGGVMIEGFGGAGKMIATARQAFTAKKYNLSAKLLSFVLDAEPDNEAAKQLKAKALRAMAQTTRSGIQTRNFMLTHALHLEGKLDWSKPSEFSMVPPPTVDSMMRMPVGTLVKVLETKIDPVKSAALVKTITIKFDDTDDVWALHIRKGVAEFSEKIPSSVDASLTITREDWIAIALKKKSFEDMLQSGHATVSGDAATLFAVLSVFD